jgi:DNA-binding NarL/FixJ family response regulator
MKLLLADDHALFREGMAHVLMQLDNQIELFEAGTCDQALEIAAGQPDLDLLLLDLNMPGTCGLAAVRAFRQKFPDLPLVVLSAVEEHDDVEQVLDAGALGFIPKSSSAQVMLSALRLVLSGGVYLPPLLLNRAAPPPARSAQQAPAARTGAALYGRMESLTDRQLEVLRLLAEGKPNKLIARALTLSEGTVKIHLAAIFRALNVNNRTEAVVAGERLLRGEVRTKS